jgi:hypothetical protein
MLTEIIVCDMLMQFVSAGRISTPWGDIDSIKVRIDSIIGFVLVVMCVIYILCQLICRVFIYNTINSANIPMGEIENLISNTAKGYKQENASYILGQYKSGYTITLKRWNRDARCALIREINTYIKLHGKRRVPPIIYLDAILVPMCIVLMLYRISL